MYEPYLTAVGYPSVLLPSYASGYNFAEANYAANLQTSWMGVYVGDPKMTPFIDSLHDIELIDARAYGNYTEGYGGEIELALQNLGMSSRMATSKSRTCRARNYLQIFQSTYLKVT